MDEVSAFVPVTVIQNRRKFTEGALAFGVYFEDFRHRGRLARECFSPNTRTPYTELA